MENNVQVDFALCKTLTAEGTLKTDLRLTSEKSGKMLTSIVVTGLQLSSMKAAGNRCIARLMSFMTDTSSRSLATV